MVDETRLNSVAHLAVIEQACLRPTNRPHDVSVVLPMLESTVALCGWPLGPTCLHEWLRASGLAGKVGTAEALGAQVTSLLFLFLFQFSNLIYKFQIQT